MRQTADGRYVRMREDKIFRFLNFLANNPILTLICIIFFVGDIVLTTCIIYNRIYQKKIIEFSGRYNELMDSRDRLDKLVKGMQVDYRQVSEKLNRMDGMYKELQEQNRQAQAGFDTKMASLKEDLRTCQNTNLNFISRISKKDSVIGSLKNQLHGDEEISEGLKKLFARQLTLGPTWIEEGEHFTTSNGDFVVVVGKASDRDGCVKGSTAVVRLYGGNDKKTLCVGTGRPESFRHDGKEYAFDLLGVGESEKGPEYLVSIVKK